MKKKVLTVSILIILLAILGTGTLAAFTTSDTAHNVITSGRIDIELIEKTRQDGVLVDFPEGGISGVMPGADVSKIVSVQNTGTAPAWICVEVMQDITAGGKALPIQLEDGTPVISYTVDETKWVTVKEADSVCYYYREAVPSGEVTPILFEEVHFAAKMDNRYQGCTAHIEIQAKAVQSDNNPIPAGGTAADVKGW